MQLLLYVHAIVAWSTLCLAHESAPKKRQIYREQVLPHVGGKIPDTAFQTDRLFLNRLQSEGISVPDGIVPEARNPYVYQYHNKSPRTVYRIALSSDGRYTPSVGKYHFRELPSVETTYLYPLTHVQNGRFATTTLNTVPSAASLTKSIAHQKPTPVYPVYRQFQLYNTHLNPVKLQAHKKTNFASNQLPNVNNIKTQPYKSHSYQNFNIFNTDDLHQQAAILDVPTLKPTLKVKSTAHKHSAPLQYNANQLFNEFDELFNNFDLYENDSTLQHRYKSDIN